ncbi:hypothetical protein Pcinc_017354 [Petrolisthes cinctipes]|uniref:Phosphatidylinositol 3-kinase n=1 Tax=Petrolisthes cinctipes TaxID=88211 RepID=A0AAE1FPD5_PETCI|nr:hypothetical protein Pcinc_017354 [Petrolisthes cinctipes]
MVEYAKYILKLNSHQQQQDTPEEDDESCSEPDITDIASKDPLADLTPSEKETLWRCRWRCGMKVPQSLPKLLLSFSWAERDNVSQVHLLLDTWGTVPYTVALELLQERHPDPTIRQFAVQSLDSTLADHQLAKFMLQLVAILRLETSLDNALVRMLLRRSLASHTVGSALFWHLRAEEHRWPNPERASAILEAYCRGCGLEVVKQLVRQTAFIHTLTNLAQEVTQAHRCQEEQTNELQRQLQHRQLQQHQHLHHLPSPVIPGVDLGDLKPDQCRVMKSATRPLWLVWDNPHPMANHYTNTTSLILKRGDDLRQDMLIIQVVSTMGQIWHSEGLDLRLMPYTCLATGNNSGIIEVVRNARTVYNIQRETFFGAIQLHTCKLFQWIKMNNKGVKLDRAIENFSMSCAGYSVATFVLGIGDRHPGNIMINTDGIIFHVDFGHILGNFKKKCGVKREWAPFVLIPDFVQVISKGADNPKESKQFRRFQELCGEAYLALRKHRTFLITLFSLLVSAGMPELQCVDDIEYVRKMLALDMTEKEASRFFHSRFSAASQGAWTYKVDWFFHSMRNR